MIAVDRLKKIYDNGFEALKSVDLIIENGDLVCLLGPSGCGKSTMLNLIAGLLDPTDGDIKHEGLSITNLHPKDRSIGMVFQNYALYPHMTVMENIIFPLTVGKYKMPKAKAETIAKEYMALTDITELADKKPESMSGGQQQRVAVTRALVQKPKILLLDEPLSNLDARLRLKIREEIRRLVKKIGVTTIFVTHDQEEALSISDKIALMDKGIIQQYDNPQNLYLEPANLFVAKFIGNPVINTYNVAFDGDNFTSDNITIPKSAFLDHRFKQNISTGNYILGIRPEHFNVNRNGSLQIIIDEIEMIGRYAILHFKLNGLFSQAIIDSRETYKVGEKVELSIEMGSIFLFDPNGKRVY